MCPPPGSWICSSGLGQIGLVYSWKLKYAFYSHLLGFWNYSRKNWGKGNIASLLDFVFFGVQCFFCNFCYFWVFIFQDFPPAWNPGERNIAANVAGINFIHIQRRFMHFALKAFWFTQKVNSFTHTTHTLGGRKWMYFLFSHW